MFPVVGVELTAAVKCERYVEQVEWQFDYDQLGREQQRQQGVVGDHRQQHNVTGFELVGRNQETEM